VPAAAHKDKPPLISRRDDEIIVNALWKGVGMAESGRPVTAGELREQLQAYPTKADLRAALQDYATKADLEALRADLEDFRTSLEEELKRYATKDDLLAVRDELRTHFDTVADRFTDQFKYLHDWVDANANGLAVRVDALETGHGARLLALETRVTALESQRRRK
jgi:hypothetical protein